MTELIQIQTDRVIKVLNDTELNEWQSKIKLKSFTFDKMKVVHSAQAYQISFLKTKFRSCETWSCTLITNEMKIKNHFDHVNYVHFFY